MCSAAWTAKTAMPSRAAIAAARAEAGRPSLICAKTTIGWGSSQQAGHGFHAR